MVILSRRNANEKTREGRRFSQSTLYQVMKEESFHNPEIRATMAGCCLLDQKRTFSLMEIVDKNTKEGETAIDIGAGCGPLAFSFLNAGGDMVTAVEKSPELCQALDDTSIRLGLRDRIEIINADILDLDWILPTDIGFVMAELIGTGLLAEPMVPAMRHIRPFLREDAVFIPEQAISTVTLCDTDGFPISAPQVYDHVNMRDIDRDGVDTEVTFTMRP